MTKTTILLVDNDEDFLDTRAEFLEQEGYEVKKLKVENSEDVTKARRALESGKIDLAIIDIRLENDDDDKDRSGLNLARDVTSSVPKIILTGYPTFEYTREALSGGFSTAIGFIAKEEGPEAMLAAVREAIQKLAERERTGETLPDPDVAKMLQREVAHLRGVMLWLCVAIAVIVWIIFVGFSFSWLPQRWALGLAVGSGGILAIILHALSGWPPGVANHPRRKGLCLGVLLITSGLAWGIIDPTMIWVVILTMIVGAIIGLMQII